MSLHAPGLCLALVPLIKQEDRPEKNDPQYHRGTEQEHLDAFHASGGSIKGHGRTKRCLPALEYPSGATANRDANGDVGQQGNKRDVQVHGYVLVATEIKRCSSASLSKSAGSEMSCPLADFVGEAILESAGICGTLRLIGFKWSATDCSHVRFRTARHTQIPLRYFGLR